MNVIQKNSRVTLTFKGKLDNGETFKTVSEKQPLTITIGKNELPPTVENSLVGMRNGETKVIRVPPEEGYGERQKILLHTISKKSFSDKVVPKPGMILSLKLERGGKIEQVPATIMEVTSENVVVDYNHPLAGHHLTYHITIIHVEDDQSQSD